MTYIAVNYQEELLEVVENNDFSREEADSYFTYKWGEKYMGMFVE